MTKKYAVSYLFILPSFIFVASLLYYPVYSALYHSFTKWNLADTTWVGVGNYIELFNDPTIRKSVWNQTLITVTEVFKNIVFPLLAAELIYLLKGKYARYWFRLGFVLPMLVPTLVITLLWLNIYNPSNGLVNEFLTLIGLESWVKPWLGDPSTALGAIIMMGFPFIAGLPFLIFYAAIGGFNEEVIEAAKIDGATGWKIFTRVHLPLLIPQFKVVIILMILQSLQDFTRVFVLTGGGPGDATMTPALAMYHAAFAGSEYGYASAIGMCLFVVIICLTFFNLKFMKTNW